MSYDLSRSLRDLEQDVNAVPLAPASAVRARGETRRRRQVTAAALGTALGLALVVGAIATTVGLGPRATSPAGGDPSCGPRTTPTITPGEARVTLATDATAAQRDAVAAKLRGWGFDPTVVDRDEAWRRFQTMYCDDPDLIARTRPEQLSEYLVLRDAVTLSGRREELLRLPGVVAVIDPARGDGRDHPSFGCVTPAPADGRRVDIFLTLDSTAAQRQAIASRLTSLPGVTGFTFSDREDAYERFKRVYACAPDLVAQTRPDQLPESFVVAVTDPAGGEVVRAVIGGMPGVDAVIHYTG
jgi:hypothetical protein